MTTSIEQARESLMEKVMQSRAKRFPKLEWGKSLEKFFVHVMGRN